MSRIFQKISTAILWLLFAASVILFLATFTNFNNFIVKPLVRDETPNKADVVIVLGGGINKDTRSLPWGVEERVQKGVEMYVDGFAGKMIVTGGLSQRNGYAESELMKPYAENLGVPKDDIIEEDRSKDTHTNALYSLEIMRQYSWGKAIMVTSDFHTQRACHVFRELAMNVICVAAHEGPAFEGNAFRNLMDFHSIVREYLATVYYWLKGYI